mgnify:CR=1 FL=1
MIDEIDNIEYGELIKNFITLLTDNFVSRLELESIKKKEKLNAIILTGSFASWLKGNKQHQPSWKVVPDVNYYLLIKGSEEDIIYFGHLLYVSINETIRDVSKNSRYNYNVVLDLHPFSISPSKPLFRKDIINIQLTTRVINIAQKNLYPDYSWYGWYINHIVVYPKNYPKEKIPLFDCPQLERNKIWLRNMYLALLSYGNVLQVLPLYTSDKEHIIFEVYRYLKEIVKDGISLALTNEEFKNGKLYEIISQWKDKSIDLYKERYGKEAAEIVELLIQMEKNYLTYVKRCNNPVELIAKAIKLRNIVFEKGLKARIKEIDPENKIFMDLPWWW